MKGQTSGFPIHSLGALRPVQSGAALAFPLQVFSMLSLVGNDDSPTNTSLEEGESCKVLMIYYSTAYDAFPE
jgi:hypothetical protein